MVKGISAVDSLMNAGKTFVRENKEALEVAASGATVLGAGAATVAVMKKLTEDKVELSSVTAEKSQSWLDTLKEKLGLNLNPESFDPSEKFITDSNGNILVSQITNQPYPNPFYNGDAGAKLGSESFKMSEKYITDTDGNILISQVTNQPYPNPCYNPDVVESKISAVTTLKRPTMSEFLDNAASAKASAVDGVSTALAGSADIGFGGDIDAADSLIPDDIPDGVIDHVTKVASDHLHDALEWFLDLIG